MNGLHISRALLDSLDALSQGCRQTHGLHRAFFGQKDYQQLLVIKQLVHDLNIDTKIVRCPTIRESDGLALSSRNRYLSENERLQAASLSAALRLGVQAIKEGATTVRTRDSNFVTTVVTPSKCVGRASPSQR